MRYKKDVKEQCLKMVREGYSFKVIQDQLGPNPKAIQRYCVKAGINVSEIEKKPLYKKQKSTSKWSLF